MTTPNDSSPFDTNCQRRCPHCGVTVKFIRGPNGWPEGSFQDVQLNQFMTQIRSAQCPACNRPVAAMNAYEQATSQSPQVYRGSRFIYPSVAYRQPISTEVPPHIRSDYEEAVLILSDSQKASAALSRRCLQTLLREAAATKAKDLSDQIDEVLPLLPGYLAKQLDAVRNIGNFAAHAVKSKSTGEIVEVEPGEAEWNLDVLDLLFDFYYEQPRVAQERRDALNKKLTDAGKPPMK